MKKNGEKRQHPRLPVKIPVEYVKLSAFFVDYALDISHGGMFLATDAEMEIGTKVKVYFSLLDSGKKFIANGKVVRRGQTIDMGKKKPMTGIGIKFDRLPAKSKEVIDTLWQKNMGDKKAGKSRLRLKKI